MLATQIPTFNGKTYLCNPMYPKKAQYEKPCLYAIPHDQSDPANRLIPDREETLTLEEESRSKLNKDLFLNDVNARTKKPNVVPISTRKPKSQANKSVATPHKKTVASESTTTNSKSYYRMLYKKTSKAWKWWIAQQCPSAYTWVPKTKRKWVPKVRNESVNKKVSFAIDNIVQLILFIVDSRCTKHMTGNLSLLVYYVKGLNHNIFSIGQFCDADLEVAFRKSTCFVRDLQGNDLLTGNRGTDLYTISLQETTSSTPICLMAKASPTQAWLWHRRLSYLNFDYINLLSEKDVVIGLPNLKYVKEQLCSSCEVSKAKRSSFKLTTVPNSKGRLNLLHMDLCGLMRVASINRKRYIHEVLNLDSSWTRSCYRQENLQLEVEFKRISLTGFRSCTSRSHYRSVSKQTTRHNSPTKSLFDVGSRRISIVTVNTKEYHSDVLAIITRIMRRT
ncbi:retrovirus-related pol polyprotein from transposon TNT 1-94 [Tanacetum coccineum]|uniref:Retrovirus-related pol polyprotein from transposon TNT 1-94 n=1 Tax=Tanacetum coccineum TaxID=301880 RepID=A0ABQ4XK39_9ASTR